MRTLTDSADHAGDPDTLRARLSVDGYLYFRGLLPVPAVERAGAAVRTQLAAGGWADAEGRPIGEQRAINAKEAASDPAYLRASSTPPFNRIPYLKPLRSLVRSLLGADAFSYPVKVLRAVYPEGAKPPRGRYVHADYLGTAVNDMVTTWVPLMPIPRSLGGLAVLPGSHRSGPQPLRVLGDQDEGWAIVDYAMGDVLLFHCLTSHAALPNRGDRLRLSQDSRWQSGSQPAPLRMIYGPKDPSQGEVYNRLFQHRPWWEPVPASVQTIPRERLYDIPMWSRFFPVEAQRWAQRVEIRKQNPDL